MVVCESSPFSLGVRKSCKSINLFAAAGVGFSSETVAQKMSQKAIYLYTHIIISATGLSPILIIIFFSLFSCIYDLIVFFL
jgi:hypothetical protein